MSEQKNKVLELLFYAVLCIVFIALFFIRKPYDRKEIKVNEPAKITVESKVDKYDAISEQP